MVEILTTLDWRYLCAAVVLTFVSYGLRAVRWRYLLIHERAIPLSSLYPATIIGYMANNILPARLGEFVRAYALAEREHLPMPTVFASLVIDRLFDGATVILLLVLTLFTLDLPHSNPEMATALRVGGMIMGAVYCTVLFFLLLLRRNASRALSMARFVLQPFPAGFSIKVLGALDFFIAGIRMTTGTKELAVIVVSSLLIWVFALLPVDMILQAFGIHLPLSASMFILVLLVFAVMVPASPGYIGTYHYACFKGLSAFGMNDELSLSVAVIVHASAFFPVILAGCYHVWRGGFAFSTNRTNGVAL